MSNAATIARAYHACVAGFALVILPASLAEAEYGPRTTIGTNYQQTSNTRSGNGSTVDGCMNFISCYVLFQPPPAQKPLIVQHVSCRVSVSGVGSLIFVSLETRKEQTFPLKRTFLVPVKTADTWWVVNSPVMHLVESGERPRVHIENNAGAVWESIAGGTECTISGRLQ